MQLTRSIETPREWRVTADLLLFTFLTASAIMAVLPMAAEIVSRELTSDSLYGLALYKDLFVDRYALKGWNLTAARGFFPDMLVLFPALAVTPDYGIGYALYCLLFVVLTVGATAYAARAVVADKAASLLCAAAAVLLVLLLLAGSHPVTRWFLIPVFHGGAFLAGLVCLGAHARWLKTMPGPIAVSALLAIETATLFSDFLFAVQFLAPIAMASLVVGALSPARRRAVLLNVGIPAIAWLLSFGLNRWLDSAGWIHAPPPFTLPTLFRIATHPNLRDLSRSLIEIGSLRSGAPLAFLLLPISVIAAIAFLGRQIWTRFSAASTAPEATFFCVFFLFQVAFTAVAPGIGGLWTDLNNTRYVYPLYLSPPLFLCVGLAASRPRRMIPWSAVSLLLAAAACWFSIPSLHHLDREDFRLPYPPWVRCMDDLARRYSLQGGLSGFWDASYLTQLSRERLRVLELDWALRPSTYFDNPNWYTGAKRSGASGQSFQFLLADNFDLGRILGRFGAPQAEERCEGKRVFIYPQGLRP